MFVVISRDVHRQKITIAITTITAVIMQIMEIIVIFLQLESAV